MKPTLLVLLGLLTVEHVVAHKLIRPFKLGETVIDFDEEQMPEEAKHEEPPKFNFDTLMQKDTKLLKDFDRMMDSASRNAEKGELNREMGNAQAEQLYQNVIDAHQNMVQEYSIIE